MIDAGEVRLHVAEARPSGAGDGATVPAEIPLVVFLHGFPEFWWSWRHQLEALAAAGFWAVAPDMRGYNESDKPGGVASYELEKLAGDVAGLVRALGRRDAIVVGHDWGAMVAWATAMLHPDVVRRLGILNVPHPLEMQKGLRRPAQLKKSWYMFFFQLPGIPERKIAKDDFAYLRETFAVDGFPAAEIEPYVDAMRVPGAVTAAVNYYRAAMRRLFKGSTPETKRIDCPVLVIWGEKDRYLGKEMATPPAEWVPDARVVFIPEATHWVQNAAAPQVNQLLVDFAKGS
jgi:pimeloyl-ACP methyl ester carboxylesterase